MSYMAVAKGDMAETYTRRWAAKEPLGMVCSTTSHILLVVVFAGIFFTFFCRVVFLR